MEKITIEKLWEYACTGNIKALKAYYTRRPGNINKRYERFGTEHSLIAGAFRNNQFSTVNYLLSIGETITPEEQERIDIECRRIRMMMKLSKTR